MEKILKLFRRISRTALLGLCLVAALAVTARADGVSDEVEKYAKKLANEEGISSVIKVTRGSGSNQYQTNQTAASNGRNLYVFELINAQSYGNENSDMDFAIFWKTGNNVYYTYTKDNGGDHLQWDTHCQDSHKSLAGQTGGETYWGLRGGKRDILTIVLPHTNDSTEFLGVYFHKTGYATKAAGKHAWSGTSMKVARVKGTISSIGVGTDGMRYVNYSPNTTAYYVAGRESMTVCDYKSSCDTAALNTVNWGHGLFKLDKLPQKNANTSAHNSIFILEMVAGETGYVNMKGNVTIHYTNGLGMKLQKVLDFDTAYEQNYPGTDHAGISTINTVNWPLGYNYQLTGTLSSLSDHYIHALSNAYVGNFYEYGATDTLLRPYTGTSLSFVMTQDIASIDKIVVTLSEGSKTAVMQSLRLIQASEFNGTNYFNGTYSLERTKSWKGHVIAQSKSIASIGAKSSFTYQGTSKSNGLNTYAYGQGPYLDNSGTALGVSVHFADVLGAGIEALLAQNQETPASYDFVAESSMWSDAGSQQVQAYSNLSPFYQESITLEVTYKDTLGCTRKVQIPFVTSYILKMLIDNKGDLTGGSRAQWISGILQQNETAGLTLRLAQYQELVSVKLSYGSGPQGFTADYDNKAIDTAKDPISVESICIYEGANDSNFRTVYDSYYKSCLLETSLTPTYFWQASTEKGQQLSGSGSLTTTMGGTGRNALKKGSPKAWSTKNKYLVQLIASDVETAGTDDPINAVFNYTNTAGKQVSTSTLSLPTLMANFYGTNYRDASETHMYARHMRRNCSAEFIIELEDVATFDSVTLTLQGDNEYQFRAFRIYRLDGLSQRWAQQWNENTDKTNAMHLYWKRSFSTDKSLKVAESTQVVQLYKNANQKTVYFTTYDASGTATPPEVTDKDTPYMTTIPSTMTFEQTRQNLGLSIVKYTYNIDVKVADSEDSGSNNYFYFQLQFSNGSSAVVLANQQLLSDSFRAGKIESFSIKTTQHLGDLLSVRIICDHTSSTSDVFDKLNIEYVNISLQDGSGVSKTWVVDNVGWIDIAYTDEGASFEIDGVEVSGDRALTNAQIVKDFPITRTVAALDLMFSITTDSESAYDKDHTFNNALGKGGYQAVLNYIDSEGIEQTKTLNLLDYIKDYNDSPRVMWMFRPNKTDRFIVSLTDVASIQSLVITREGGAGVWKISSVTVQQISGLSGSVYMTSMDEYWRPYENAEEIASSTNAAGVPYSLEAGATATVTFTENEIELVSTEDSVTTVISREPITRMESLNIYVFSGSVAGLDYTFTNRSPALKVTAVYNNALGAPTQASFTLNTLGTIGGETVMYAKGLSIDGITTITNLRISSTATSIGAGGPVIRQVVVQRVRSGVVVGTYFFDCLNTDISVAPNISYAPSSYASSQITHQTVTFQPGIDQKLALTAETYDVAVALRYTSTMDPSGTKAVYQTPYVYLTDVDIHTIVTGKNITVPFDVPYVDQIIGLALVTTGPKVTFDNAIIHNYSGREANADMLLSTTGLDQTIVADTVPSVVNSDGKPVLPAVFQFTTPSQEAVPNGGTSGKVSMIVNYRDNNDTPQSMAVQDILRFLGDGVQPDSGTTVELPILLSNVVSIQSVQITAEDDWFISTLSVKLTNPDGTTTHLSNSANNWAKGLEPLTIELGENVTGNYIQGFSITALTGTSGSTATSDDSQTMTIKAYTGETVMLLPDIQAIGVPDMTWSWEPVATGTLNIQPDNTAIFTVPESIAAGQSLYVTAYCNGNQQLQVKVRIEVINQS